MYRPWPLLTSTHHIYHMCVCIATAFRFVSITSKWTSIFCLLYQELHHVVRKSCNQQNSSWVYFYIPMRNICKSHKSKLAAIGILLLLFCFCSDVSGLEFSIWFPDKRSHDYILKLLYRHCLNITGYSSVVLVWCLFICCCCCFYQFIPRWGFVRSWHKLLNATIKNKWMK